MQDISIDVCTPRARSPLGFVWFFIFYEEKIKNAGPAPETTYDPGCLARLSDSLSSSLLDRQVGEAHNLGRGRASSDLRECWLPLACSRVGQNPDRSLPGCSSRNHHPPLFHFFQDQGVGLCLRPLGLLNFSGETLSHQLPALRRVAAKTSPTARAWVELAYPPVARRAKGFRRRWSSRLCERKNSRTHTSRSGLKYQPAARLRLEGE